MKSMLVGLLLLLSGAVWAAPIQVTVDGSPVLFDQPPIEVRNRVLVPVRGVFERLGATVNYNAATRTVTATRGTDTVMLALGSSMATINGTNQTLDVPPISTGGRILVPLRFISEALGADVDWLAASNLVRIKSERTVGVVPMPMPPVVPAPPAASPLSIESITHNASVPLVVGQPLIVTVRGTPGATAVANVGSATIPLTEMSPGVYQGSYIVQPNDAMLNVQANVTLRDSQGRSLSQAAPQLVTLGKPLNVGNPPVIHALSHSGAGPWAVGYTFAIRARGTPNMTAVATIGNRTVAMNEVTPGHYVGTYTMRPEDNMVQTPVKVSLTDGLGRSTFSQDYTLVTMVGDPSAAALPPIQSPITIMSPAMRSTVGGVFEVSGRAPVGSHVVMQMFHTTADVPTPSTYTAKIMEATQTVGNNGEFHFSVTPPLQPGQRIAIVTRAYNAAGAQVGEATTARH